MNCPDGMNGSAASHKGAVPDVSLLHVKGQTNE
jgi:hypothetical protein